MCTVNQTEQLERDLKPNFSGMWISFPRKTNADSQTDVQQAIDLATGLATGLATDLATDQATDQATHQPTILAICTVCVLT